MVPGLDLAVGYLIAWVTRKAGRAGKHLDADADLVIDTELGKLHHLIAAKLGADTALAKLEEQTAAGEQVSDLTRRRVTDALADAADTDAQFAASLTAALSALASIGPSPTTVTATGDRSAAAGRDVYITATNGSAAAQTMGDVTVGGTPPDPSQPDRTGG